MHNHRILVHRCLYFTLTMFAFSFALVPLYDVFCQVTGLNGKPNLDKATLNSELDNQKNLDINFLSHNQDHLPIRIKPIKERMLVNTSTRYQQIYLVTNLSNTDITIQAIPSVSPGQAARYLNKVECFCFKEQLLKAGSSSELSLDFFIEHTIPNEFEEIYLSYAFFKKDNTKEVPSNKSPINKDEHPHAHKKQANNTSQLKFINIKDK